MKRLLLFIIATLTTTSLWAQQSTITSRLSDINSGEGVIGAVVELSSLDSKREPLYTTSAYDGAVKFTSVNYGEYQIKATFLGYKDYIDTIKVFTPRFVLKDMPFGEASTEIDAVVKVTQALRTSQSGDTLSYSAGAFKVATDADLEGLLKKMPGITITDGEVSAQGETIKKIFVDGREFFGTDVTTAINSLPAEIVESVDVYDKLSDNAELSGMDDGEGYKSINIVTKPNMREGFFGKLYAGYGYQPEVQGNLDHNKYTAGGNVNYFKGSHRVTLLGLLNNINKQDFSFDDILGVSSEGGARPSMVRPQPGVAKVGALGVNYSGAFGESDKVKLEGSYFYNGTETENLAVTDRWYEEPLPTDTLHQEVHSITPNYNNRINGKLTWKISESQQLTVRQSASFQMNTPYSTTDGARWGESGYNITRSASEGDKFGYNSSTNLSYMTRLYKPGRTLSVNGGFSINSNENLVEAYSNGAPKYKNPDGSPVTSLDTVGLVGLYGDELIDLIYRSMITPTSSQTLSSGVTYAEPLSNNLRFTLKYNFSNNNQETEKSTYYTSSDYSIEGLEPNPAASNSRQTEYTTHRVGPGLYYSKGQSKFSLGVDYQYATLTGDAIINGGTGSKINKDYINWTYSAMGKIYFNPQNSLRMYINSRTSNPWVGYLVDAYNLTNVQNISKGNPDLVPSYNNNLRMHFVRSNVERGTTFMIMGAVDNTSDYIGKHIVYEPAPFEIDGEMYEPMQYSTNVNLDNYWRVRSMINFGFPINPIRCNLNLQTGVSYSLVPSMFGGTVLSDGTIEGGELNLTDNIQYNGRAVLGSNISENVDFTLSWNGSYNEATNSASESNEKNKYVSQSAMATMKFVFGAGFTFTASSTYNQYMGITNDYNESFILCNAYIGKKVFRNQRGELNVGVNDILDQNTAFSRNVGSGYTENVVNSVIGRYFTIQLVYNLRSFGGKGSHGGGHGPGGPGGGGHRGGGRPMF